MKAIVAMSQNFVIGDKGLIPWYVPEDLQRFKELTMGKQVIMGRKTHESIGRLLPGRENIILSRANPVPEFAEDAFVIGGSEVYNLLVPKCDTLYVTWMLKNIDGDTVFDRKLLDLFPHEIERSALKASGDMLYRHVTYAKEPK